MPVLYLVTQQTVLRKAGKRLLFCSAPPANRKSRGVREQDILLELTCQDIDQVMLFGNIQVTTQALYQLLRHDIELALFSSSGYLLGQLTPPKQKNIALRVQQFHQANDMDFCLEFSKELITQKIESGMKLLQDYKKHDNTRYTKAEWRRFKTFIGSIQQAANLDSLRGIEGSASQWYFSLYGRLFHAPWEFKGRSRRPPEDAINAVLSFGYVVLASEIQSLLDGRGFDPYLGYYHQLRYGRPSLALDILETYRHSFIDRLALHGFNKKIFQENHFYERSQGGIYLNQQGKQKFFRLYEKMQGNYIGSVPDETKALLIRKKLQDAINTLVQKHLI